MKVEQYVMAYGIEQDRVRAILPEGFVSLRPVLRINAEIRDEKNGYVEFNTAVEKDGKKGWLNIGYILYWCRCGRFLPGRERQRWLFFLRRDRNIKTGRAYFREKGIL